MSNQPLSITGSWGCEQKGQTIVEEGDKRTCYFDSEYRATFNRDAANAYKKMADSKFSKFVSYRFIYI
jgi:hypothetical protein